MRICDFQRAGKQRELLLQNKIESGPPENTQPPRVRRPKKLHLDQIPAAKLDVDHPLTEEEDEDFEKESDEDDTVALLQSWKEFKQQELKSRPGRNKNKS